MFAAAQPPVIAPANEHQRGAARFINSICAFPMLYEKNFAMKLLMQFAIILILPFMFVSAPETQNTSAPAEGLNLNLLLNSPAEGRYCNSRFEFCVSYPEKLLPGQKVSDNDDGVILSTADRLTEVSIGGSFNVLQWSPKELYQFNLESLHGGKPVKEISSEFGDDFYESYFLADDGMSYYHRAIFIKHYYILLIIKAPVNQPEMMQRLREEVAIDFQS